MADSRLVIDVHNLIKRFGSKTVLSGLNFQVDMGEFVALLGPNGAGKTTFLRILSSLVRPTLGSVLLAGYRLPEQASAVRSRLGVVSHLPLLYGDLSAEENLMFYARLYDLAETKERIQTVIQQVGLSARRKDLVRTFSRGMQQRLSIGRAILHNPSILLLDEPHTGLDQEACEMLDEVLKQVTGSGRTVVMTSHDLVRIEDLASRFDILSRGRIQASLSKDEIPVDGLLTAYRQVLQKTSAGGVL
ncbi:MAG: heme ABC exporter ATP-binding protein CcmA [Leptolinea sp.]